MGKNIVVFSDGTNQKGGIGYNTNVYKLFNMIETRTKNQIAYYDPGLGTNWQKLAGAITGLGFSKNILDCYRFIFENYEAGDSIYLFGFSRGAATVRSLSGFMHHFGILPQSRPDLIKEAFSIYKIKNKEQRNKRAKEFIKKHHTMWCKIKFLGVWDTVTALGFPIKWLSIFFDHVFPHRFHSFELSEAVEYARHALSIDDERKTFHPTLWDPLKNDSSLERMKQVWFCGVHTDVGGGYMEEDLSNISLRWMIREATSKGLIIYEDSPAYKEFITASPDINGIMHNEQKGFPGKFFKRAARTWNINTHGYPTVHESVLKRKKNNENSLSPRYNPWILTYKEKNIEL